MGRFAQPCLDCGKVTRNGARCPKHAAVKEAQWDAPKAARKRATGQYAGDYRKRARLIRETAQYCWICGGPVDLYDPMQADHVIPGDPDSPLAPAHRSCNAARGNKPMF